MGKKRLLLIVFSLVQVAPSFAAKVDISLVKSPSTSKDAQVVVVMPDAVLGKKVVACPAIYLLHGYGGDAKIWIGTESNLPQIVDERGIIFVCPDGRNSWYWDGPLNPSYCYETFIPSGLVRYIDEHHKTTVDRKGRAIIGLSTGGHGAMWDAICHRDTFSVSGNTSGGTDTRPFPKSWDMSKQLGKHESNKEVQDNHTTINQIDKIENGDLAIIIDCEERDFFLNVNKDSHNRLLEKKINHDFIIRPGGRAGQHWNNSIDYQTSFFDKSFKR